MRIINKKASNRWLTNKGFTLLEVMIALTIFALLATSLSQATIGAIDNQITIEQKVFANWIAENEIIEMRSKPWPDIKSESSNYKMANLEWIIVKKVVDKKSFSGVAIPLEVKEVSVNVSLKDESSSIITLTAYLANESL
ncbi:MAG: general secretion pathway protein I [Bermanella sp.]|jgi:general secretion pathway protein I